MKDRTLEEFLAAVAAPTPTPGGGSVSALAGALSVALSRMVAGLARGKKGYESVESELAQLESVRRRDGGDAVAEVDGPGEGRPRGGDATRLSKGDGSPP